MTFSWSLEITARAQLQSGVWAINAENKPNSKTDWINRNIMILKTGIILNYRLRIFYYFKIRRLQMLDSLPFMSCIYVKYNNLFQEGYTIMGKQGRDFISSNNLMCWALV